jgi:hypothetical protein
VLGIDRTGISPEVKEALEAVAKNEKYIVGEANDTNEVGAMGDFCGHWGILQMISTGHRPAGASRKRFQS